MKIGFVYKLFISLTFLVTMFNWIMIIELNNKIEEVSEQDGGDK